MSDQNVSGFPLSQQQQRLFELRGLSGQGNVLLIDFKGRYNEALLRDAIECFLQREENLNTLLASNHLSKLPLQDIREEPQAHIAFRKCMDKAEALAEVQNVRQMAFHGQTNEVIRFDCWTWEDSQALLLVSCSRFFSDYHSLMLLFQCLDEVFEKGKEQTAPEEDALQYVDYSEWQRELRLEESKNNQSYWRNLGNSSQEFSRIFDFSEDKKTSIAVHSFTINTPTARALKAIADTQNLELADVLMAFWWQLLQLYTENTFTLSYSYPARMEGETDRIFGLFEKSLPIATKEEKNELWDLAANIRQVRANHEVYHPHYHYGVDKNSGKKRRHPYSFACRELPSVSGLQLEAIESHSDEFELKLETRLMEGKEEIICQLYYAPEIFSKAWILSLSDQLIRRVELEVLKATEGESSWKTRQVAWAQDLQETLNGAIKPTSTAEKTLLDLLEQAESKHPDKTALVYDGFTLSYAALQRQTNQMARVLSAQVDGQTSQVIAVQLENPVHMILAFIAIAKSGNAFLPLDQSNPQQRTQYILEQSEAALFLCDDNWLEAEAPGIGLTWASIQKELPNQSAEALVKSISPQSLCYLIYTSGTTGRPKGVMISHAALVNYLDWVIHHFHLTENDRTVLFSSMAFDLGHTIIWSALSVGAQLHLTDPGQSLKFLENSNAYILEQGITYIKCTPSHFKLILNDSAFAELAPQQQLRLILLGGEHIDAVDLASYFEGNPKALIVNEYGPTETTIGVVAKEITVDNIERFRGLPVIGNAFGGHNVLLLDEQGQAVMPGTYGAMYLSGPGLSLGYLNRPELSQKAFVTLPYRGEKRLFYATGDLARWMPDGDIQLAGRMDSQVKIRGYRIEPDGISEAIRKLAEVSDASTLVRRRDNGDLALWTFVVPADSSFELEDLRRQLSEQFPAYMVPDQIFDLEAIPLNPNGKVDQNVLLEQAEARLQNQVLLLPQEQDEKVIAKIWRDLLKVESVGLHQRFFQIGGHSLVAMKMLARVHQQLNVRISLVDFFKHPTIEALVALVRQSHKEQVESIQQVVRQHGEQGHFELSMAQKRIWMHEQLKEKDGTYNIYFACLFKGGLQLEALEKALNHLVHRHENFRTNFIEVDGEVRQKIIAPEQVAFRVDVLDTRIYSPEEITEVIIEKCNIGFDLEKDLLFKCIWLNTTKGNPMLLFNFHHIILDEWSAAIFEREIKALLAGHLPTDTEVFPPLPIQYKDFAVWENIQLQKESLNQMKLFFQRQFLGPLPTLSLPTDFPRGAQQSFAGHSAGIELSADEYRQILQFCEERACSLLVFFMALTKVLLFRLTQQSDIVVGTMEANRHHPDLEHIIGCFFNILPIRTQFKKEISFDKLLAMVQGQFSSTMTYSFYPFNFLLRDLNVKADPGRSPLFDVMVSIRSLEGGYDQIEKIGDLEVIPHPLPSLYSKYDLLFDFVKEENALRLIIEYNKGLFVEASIREYLQLIRVILKAVLANPQMPINQIGDLAEADEAAEDSLETFFNF